MTDEQEGPIWSCRIGLRPTVTAKLAAGADRDMRHAVAAAFKKVTNQEADFIFSGWGDGLSDDERSVVEEEMDRDRQ